MDRYKVFPSGELGMHPTGNWTPYADAQATVEALQARLAAAQNVKADYDRWLSGGVYFTTAEYEKHVAEHRQHVEALQRERDFFETAAATANRMRVDTERALDAEREKAKNDATAYRKLSEQWNATDLELSQLQALVRALVDKLDESDKASQGIFITAAMHGIHYNGPSYADELQALKATLDATTPAPDTSIIGKCEPPSQWDPNAQVRGDIS